MNRLAVILLCVAAAFSFLLFAFLQLFESNSYQYLNSLTLLTPFNRSAILSVISELSNSFVRSPSIPSSNFSASHCSHRFGKILLFRTSYGNKPYAPSRDSVQCYAHAAGHYLADVDTNNDNYAKTICAEFSDRNFRRHCILAQYLKNSDAKYAVAMDGDVAVVNPNHCIEDYIDSNASVIFYERFHTFEVAACSFIVKNDDYGIEFFMDWARYSRKVPRVSWSNSDNGALLSLLLEKRQVTSHERAMCTRLWQRANALIDYLRYIHCAYIFLGSKRKDLSERIQILRRGHGWGRDGWTSDGRWCDHDFFMHAIKADDYSSDMSDTSSPFSHPFNLKACNVGLAFNDAFHMKPQLHISCDELRTRLKKRLIVPQTLTVPYLDDSDLDCWPNCDKRK